MQAHAKDPVESIAERLTPMLNKHSSKLIRLAGVTGICGGLLWVTFVALLHMQIFGIVSPDAFYADLFYADVFEKLLGIPLLLFVLTALGMLVLLNYGPSRRGYVGILLIFTGLGLSAGTNIYYYWLGHRWDSWGGLGPDLMPYSWVEWWLPTVWGGFFILSVGLMLLLSAIGRTRSLPSIAIFVLIGSLMLIYLLPWLIPDEKLLFDEFGLMLWALVLTGLAWAFVGAAFLRQARKLTYVTS